MKPGLIRVIALCGSATLLAACAGTPDESASGDGQPSAEQHTSLPEWVSMPRVEDGIAASSCVSWSGYFDVDRRQALANARQELAQQIDIRVQGMDETYARRTRGGDEDVIGSVFETVSRQVTDQNLRGAIPQRIEAVTIGDEKQLCAMIAMQPDKTRELFEQIIDASGEEIAARDEEVLYEEFKADQARERMDEALAD